MCRVSRPELGCVALDHFQKIMRKTVREISETSNRPLWRERGVVVQDCSALRYPVSPLRLIARHVTCVVCQGIARCSEAVGFLVMYRPISPWLIIGHIRATWVEKGCGL
jgi:hypothetical protein